MEFVHHVAGLFMLLLIAFAGLVIRFSLIAYYFWVTVAAWDRKHVKIRQDFCSSSPSLKSDTSLSEVTWPGLSFLPCWWKGKARDCFSNVNDWGHWQSDSRDRLWKPNSSWPLESRGLELTRLVEASSNEQEGETKEQWTQTISYYSYCACCVSSCLSGRGKTCLKVIPSINAVSMVD